MNPSLAKLTGRESDAMVDRGAFDCIEGKKVELIRGELRFMNPAGPIQDDYSEYLTRWSVMSTLDNKANIRVQCGFDSKSYRKIEIVVAPSFLSPSCNPDAKLDLADLFSVP